MKKNVRVILFVMLMSFFCGTGVQAAKEYTYTANVDLNGDGIVENVKIIYYDYEYFTKNKTKPQTEVYINDQLMMKLKNAWGYGWYYNEYNNARFIVDLNANDKYKELFFETQASNYDTYQTLYRYSGGKLKKYVSGYVDYSDVRKGIPIFESKKRIPVPFDFEMIPGDGTIVSEVLVKGYKGSMVNDVRMTYKVSKGKWVLSSGYHECKAKTAVKAHTKLYAYKYPRVTSNKKVFTLSKGSKYIPLQYKFTKNYTYFQVKKGTKKGWFVIKTRDLKLSAGL